MPNTVRFHRVLRAAAEKVYKAFIDPDAMANEVRGILVGPAGGRAHVVTAWIVLNDEESPRFLTAFPGEAR